MSLNESDCLGSGSLVLVLDASLLELLGRVESSVLLLGELRLGVSTAVDLLVLRSGLLGSVLGAGVGTVRLSSLKLLDLLLGLFDVLWEDGQ